MGPPVNVRVQATVQGYLVTWEPPAYGKEQVRLYAVRWFRGPSEQLYGRAETTDTYYLGNCCPSFIKQHFQFVALYLIFNNRCS